MTNDNRDVTTGRWVLTEIPKKCESIFVRLTEQDKKAIESAARVEREPISVYCLRATLARVKRDAAARALDRETSCDAEGTS
jgi:uncharacterized protein (DUF1778 family)